MRWTTKVSTFGVVAGSVLGSVTLGAPVAQAGAGDTVVAPDSLTHQYCPAGYDLIAPSDPNGDFACEIVFFPSSEQSWTVPAGVESVDVLLGGGGGGGGGGSLGTDSWEPLATASAASAQRYYAGGGGGAGEIEQHLGVTVTPESTITLSVGLGGNYGGVNYDGVSTLAGLVGKYTPATPGNQTSWNSGEFVAEGGGAGGGYGFTTDTTGWSGGGGAGVGEVDSVTTGTTGTSTGHGGGNGTTTVISCADLAYFYSAYTDWAGTCPYSGGEVSLSGASSNKMFVAGGGGGGNGGPGTSASIGLEPDAPGCNTSNTTVFGGDGGAPFSGLGGLFSIGASVNSNFDDFSRLGAGGGGAVISPSAGYKTGGTDCATYGSGSPDAMETGSGSQVSPADSLGITRPAHESLASYPSNGGAGGAIWTRNDGYYFGVAATRGGDGFVMIRFPALLGYPTDSIVLNLGGAQTATDGLEIPLGGGQMQVYRYNPAYQSIGAGGCTPAACELVSHAAAPHQAQFYDSIPPADPNIDGSPNSDLGTGWYLSVLDDAGATKKVIGPIVICDECGTPDPPLYTWESAHTFGGSVAIDHTDGTYKGTATTELTYFDTDAGVEYFMTVEVNYTGHDQFANVNVSLRDPGVSGQTYRVFHVLDTYLIGGDQGPGFYDDSDADHPMVGVRKTLLDGSSIMIALRNNALDWSGYASKHYECADNGFSSQFGAPCSPGGELRASEAMFEGGALWTGSAAIEADPSTDNGIAAMWELPTDGTVTTGAIDYDLVFQTTTAPVQGNVYIGGRTYDSKPQSCSNTPFHSLFAALDTSRSGLPVGEEPAAEGDTVYVCPGTFYEKFTSQVAPDVTIVGVDASGNPATGEDRPVVTKSYVEDLVGPLLDAGKGDITVRNLVIDGSVGVTDINASDIGGGAISGHNVSVYDSTIDNAVGGHGGAIHAGGDVWVERSTFTGNKSYLTGCDSDPGCVFTGTSSADGGAIWAGNGLVTVIDSSFDGNTTFGSDATGGAILSDRIEVRDSSFTDNDATRKGGAIYSVGLTSGTSWSTKVSGSSFTGNHAVADGGAIDTDRAIVDESSFVGNAVGGSGGAVNAAEWAEVTNSTFTGNTGTSESDGGAIRVLGEARYPGAGGVVSPKGTVLGSGPIASGPRLNVWGSTFTGNSSWNGGAIITGAPAYIESSLFTSNHGAVIGAADGSGGAIVANEMLQVVSSTFDRNDTDDGDGNDTGLGGAINSAKDTPGTPSVIITNSTFSGNSSSQGGAISAYQTKVTYSTFFDNAAPIAGAVNVYGTFEVANSVFLDNASLAGGSCIATNSGSFTDLGGNVSDDADCAPGATFAPRAAMNLGDLADNGGPTPTVAFVKPSVLENAAYCGLATDVTVDQRGVGRANGGCDAGAYEYLTPQDGPGSVYIVGRYYNGSSDHDSTDSLFGDATSCTNTPYHLIGDAVLMAREGDTVHVCGLTDSGARIGYEEPLIQVVANDLTIEGDNWDSSLPETLPTLINGPVVDPHGLFSVAPSVTEFSLNRVALSHGSSTNGGAVYAPNALVTVTNSSIAYSQAMHRGGAIYARSVVVTSTPEFLAAGQATYFNQNYSGMPTDSVDPMAGGGAIYARDSARIESAGFGVSITTGDGGAVLARDIVVDQSQFFVATASGVGGAIASTEAGGSVTIDESGVLLGGLAAGSLIGTLLGGSCAALCGPGTGTLKGGAVAVTGANSTLSITSSSFTLNEVSGTGGAVYAAGASLSVTNSSFIQNIVTGEGSGAAVGVEPGVVVQLQHDSFLGNVGYGSSVDVRASNPDTREPATDSWVANSMFADSLDPGADATDTTCHDLDGTLANGGGNLTTDDDCPGQVATAAELALEPLTFGAVFGGGSPNIAPAGHGLSSSPFDFTIVPGAGSIAYDFIDPVDGACAVDVDQVGTSRPQIDGCDAGAYELKPDAAVLYVEQDNTVGGGSCESPDFNTVTEALAAANSGDTVHVCAGVYREDLLAPTDSNLTIEGDGPIRTIFDGESRPGDPATRHGILDASGAENLTVTGVTFRHGSALNGGAIFGGTHGVTLESVRFEDNSATLGGGALAVAGDTSLTGVQFSGNSAGVHGGAVYAVGNVTVHDSSFGENSALGGAGGAIYAPGYVVTVSNSTFAGNTAELGDGIEASAGMGGAIYAEMISTSFVSFYGNQAATAGAALYADNAGSLTLKASLFLHSSVDGTDGGSCAVSDGGTITDGGGNISSDDTCYDTLDSGSQENVDYTTVVVQDVDPYDFWGGPTKTLKLIAGTSPAIDYVACTLDSSVIVDQRGIHRPQQEQCDSGAFEFYAADPAVYIVGRFYDGTTEGPEGPGTSPESCTNTPYSTIAAAVAAADDDDVVHVCPGTYVESNIGWSNSTLTIEGEGPGVTIVDADSSERAFSFAGDTITLKSMTVENGLSGGNGGAIEATVVHAYDVVFSANTATNGGAIYVADNGPLKAEVSLIGCVFDGNGDEGTHFGGAVYANNDGQVFIDSSEFTDNQVDALGVSSVGDVKPSQFPITATGASIDGSGGAVLAGSITAVASTFTLNLAATHGGALLATNVTVVSSTFTDNLADGGTGGYDSYGGAIWGSVVDVTDSTFTTNTAGAGGAIGVLAVTVDGIGPKTVDPGTVTIDSSTFDSNTALSYGGAVYNQSGAVESTNSTYYGNSAGSAGGALQSVGNMTLTENTFAENSAGTIEGGGTLLTGAEVFAADNIFKYASGDRYGYDGCQFDWDNFNTKIHDLGGNLSSDDWCTGRAWTSDEEFDLHDLADNGGPTQTMRLGRNSIARDYVSVGTGCAEAFDQRGQSRPQYTDCDAGAYEYDLLQPTITVSVAQSAIDSGASDDLTAVVSYGVGAPGPSSVATPTGQVQFYYCVPADLTAPDTCADPANWIEIGTPVDIDGTGTAYFPAWTPPADGTYEVHAMYLGDDGYEVTDTTVTGSATVVVGRTLSSIKVCVHRTSTTYGKKLGDLDVDYCVPIGECFPGPSDLGPTSHEDECCPATSPTKLDGLVTTSDDKCCPVSPGMVGPMDPGHCLSSPTEDPTEEPGSTYTVEPDLVYSEVDQRWVASTPSTDGPSAPESDVVATGGKDELPDGYYEVEPKKVYEWYGVVPPTCTVPDYEVGTPVSASPLDIVCEGGDPGTGYEFDYSLVDEQEFNVLPAQLKLKADNQHVTFGDPVPTYTYKVRGFKLGESPETASGWVDAVCTSDYSPASSAGSRFPITCSDASADNYVIKYEAGYVEVRKAKLRLSPTSVAIDYGAPVPGTYSWSLSGYTTSESPASAEMLAGYVAPTCASAYSKGSGAGVYAIRCTGGESKNYEFDTAATGTLTVRKVPLKVAPKATLVPYGTSKPMLSYTLTGFVAGESEPGLGFQAPVCTAAAYSSTTPAGTVLPASCTGGSSNNYTFEAAATSSLTVVKAPLKVVPPSVSVVYGSTLTAPVTSISGFVNGQTPSTAAGYVAPVCAVSYSVTKPAGSYPLTCTGGSASNYSFDTSSVGLLTVTKAPITITPGSATVVYGASAPVTTFTMSGFKNSQTSAVFASQPTCASAYVQGSGVGSYPVQCSGGAAANYSFVTAPAAVTVAPAPLVIQADPKVMTYGDAAPMFTVSVSGFVLGQSGAAASFVPPTCSSTFTPAKAAGAYAINCAGASLPNYAIVYKAGTLTVNKAVLTVTPAAKTITKGSTVPTYTYTVTGHQYGQTITTTAGYTAPKCTSPYTRTSAIGSYTISCSGGAATNYTFRYTTALLRVI